MNEQQIDRSIARQIIDNIKSGTTPLDTARYLDVGRERWYRGMKYYFDGASESGSSKVRFIRGRYGDGKTHLMDMAQYFALQRGFVVSYASAEDTRLDKIEEVYQRIVKNLRTTDSRGGLYYLLNTWKQRVKHPEVESERLRAVEELDINFRMAVDAFLFEDDPRRQDEIGQWLVGEPLRLPEYSIKRSLRAANSRDMLRSLSVFIRLIGHPGLLILLDELDRIQNQTNRVRQNCYQVLRELIDNADGQGGMKGTLVYCAAPSEMFTSDRGFREYDALNSRLEPALQALELITKIGGVDYRGTIINLEDTPLSTEDYYAMAVKVRDVHAIALAWDAQSALPDNVLKGMVDSITQQQRNISTPRLVTTSVAVIAEIVEQGQRLDIETSITQAQEIAEQARAQRHRRKYED
jgi:hypothetical protein